MGLILNIETSTDVCSVALSDNGIVTAKKELFQPNSHSTHLTLLIQELFKTSGTPEMKELNAVAVSAGPGSYTGLRIGTSVAKGICYALGIPLIAIDTLTIITTGAFKKLTNEEKKSSLFAPMIDARRMEVYTALHSADLKVIEKTNALIIDEESFADKLKDNRIFFFGNGAAKCKEIINHQNAVFIDNVVPLAANMSELSEQAFQNNDFVDVAYFEPFYLKSFVATISKKKFF
ncbi:MAG: tRNA (adenosine(37)-N6)-threonylcarbamoyltransferase complex dimerization subunit type 1 TsaB [Chlorobi bacterium]|nr:tRNA (adenosine(37)-N6)-threonylcarbamoyltransferase complex dimerization subunit type 1 TsaB [Chlorobiota bacterium]